MCEAITIKTKIRCSKPSLTDGSFCAQHQKMEDKKKDNNNNNNKKTIENNDNINIEKKATMICVDSIPVIEKKRSVLADVGVECDMLMAKYKRESKYEKNDMPLIAQTIDVVARKDDVDELIEQFESFNASAKCDIHKADDMFIDEINNGLFQTLFDGHTLDPNHHLELDNPIFMETFNRNQLAFIVNNLEAVMRDVRRDARDLVALDKYYLKSKSIDGQDGVMRVEYSQTHARSMYGRYQARGGMSAQNMVREVRHTIFNGYSKDIDLDNCHPVIQTWICANVGVKCDKLQYYVDNRESVFAELLNLNSEMSREDAKKLFLMINYGGSSTYRSVKNKPVFLVEYFNESARIKKELCYKFKLFSKKTRELRAAAGKAYNMDGATMSHLCCYIENQILMIIYKYLKPKLGLSINNSILCFDGIMIPEGGFDYSYIGELEVLLNKMGVPLKLSVKEFKPIDLEKLGYNDKVSYTYKPNMTAGVENIIEAPLLGNDKLYEMSIELIKSSFDDTTFIEYFLKVNHKYKSYDGVLYYFNGSHWVRGSDQYIISDIDGIYQKLYVLVKDHYDNDELIKALKKIICLRSVKYKETLIKGIIGYVRVDEDLWDLNDDLLGFKNGVYDLANDIFRAGRYEDYISMVIGHDYHDSSAEDLLHVESYFKKIMPIREERDLFLLLLSTMLSGRHLEKFIICTGAGRNGKDTTFTYLIKRVLGPYYYNCNPTAFTQKVKGDQNVSIANFDKKRVVITTEPDKDDTIKTSMVKTLTGSDETAMRTLYSQKTKVNLNETLFMLCNDKPLLDHCEQAMVERLIIIPFRSTFKTKQFMLDNNIGEGENYVYEACEDVKSDAYLDRMKLPTFNFLLPYFRKFRDDGYLIQSAPKSIKKLNEAYMEESDEFMSWFNSVYKRSDDKKDIVHLTDMFVLYQASKYYVNLSKKEIRSNGPRKFHDKILNNISLKVFYKDRVDVKSEDGNRSQIRRVITNYKVRGEERDENGKTALVNDVNGNPLFIIDDDNALEEEQVRRSIDDDL